MQCLCTQEIMDYQKVIVENGFIFVKFYYSDDKSYGIKALGFEYSPEEKVWIAAQTPESSLAAEGFAKNYHLTFEVK